MSNEHHSGEAARIQRVYEQYDRSPATSARHDRSHRVNQRITEDLRRATRRMLEGVGFWPLAGKKILDVGCGADAFLSDLQAWGASPQDLYGLDLLPDRVERARQLFPGIEYACGNAERMGFADASFDLVSARTIFSSILDEEMAQHVAAEIARVLRPDGAVLWYDMRYPNPYNHNVRGISRQEMMHYFKSFKCRRLASVTVLPPLARTFGFLYPLLRSVPPLRSHYLAWLVKPGAGQEAHA